MRRQRFLGRAAEALVLPLLPAAHVSHRGSMIVFWSRSPSSGRDLECRSDWIHLDALLLLPSLDHPFGTDNLGRDVLLRIINGAAIDL